MMFTTIFVFPGSTTAAKKDKTPPRCEVLFVLSIFMWVSERVSAKLKAKQKIILKAYILFYGFAVDWG